MDDLPGSVVAILHKLMLRVECGRLVVSRVRTDVSKVLDIHARNELMAVLFHPMMDVMFAKNLSEDLPIDNS